MLQIYQDLSSMFPLTWASDFVGCLGTLIILIVYAFLQMGKLESSSVIYSLLNIVGAILILSSLLFSWNLSAVLMEISWVIISLYGILRTLRLQKFFKMP
ncbi:hypothetical protein QPK87_30445 [Kamptonema cortianum]|jgi:hypothetical protein|nr:hypothetical protein [Geitlerinema splendidum]MDK3160845.1 hypothetical protein [Kamptonema cortianum]